VELEFFKSELNWRWDFLQERRPLEAKCNEKRTEETTRVESEHSRQIFENEGVHKFVGQFVL
jgi:hypothetical protein